MLGYPKAHTPKLTCLVPTYASTFYCTVFESASGQHVHDKLWEASGGTAASCTCDILTM